MEGTDKLQVTTDSRTHKLWEKVWFASTLRSRLQYLGPYPHIALSNTEDVKNSLDPCTGPVGTFFCLLTSDPDQVLIDFMLLWSSGLVSVCCDSLWPAELSCGFKISPLMGCIFTGLTTECWRPFLGQPVGVYKITQPIIVHRIVGLLLHVGVHNLLWCTCLLYASVLLLEDLGH